MHIYTYTHNRPGTRPYSSPTLPTVVYKGEGRGADAAVVGRLEGDRQLLKKESGLSAFQKFHLARIPATIFIVPQPEKECICSCAAKVVVV